MCTFCVSIRTALTDVVVEEDERGHVAGQTQQLRHHHQPVPGLDGEGHHEQLREDERGEGDGHDVDELRLKQQHGAVHYDAACANRDESHDMAVPHGRTQGCPSFTLMTLNSLFPF